MHFGDRIRALREGRGWNASDLAREAGVDASLISTYEAGKRKEPAAPYLVKLSKALGVTADWLLTGEGQMSRDDVNEEAADVFTTGERRFREWVSEREPQHAAKVAEFLRLLAERRFERWSAQTSALDVEEDLIKEFRAWRRGEWDDEPDGVAYVPKQRAR
jgi:transcriptional regulator with XRE-family HTH domain